MISKSLENRIAKWFQIDTNETFMERIQYTFETETMFTDCTDAQRYGKTMDYILSRISLPVEDDSLLLGAVVQRVPTQEERDTINATYKRWWDIPMEERLKKLLFYYSDQWIKCRPYWFPSMGHLALDWEELIAVGLGGLKAKAVARQGEPSDENQSQFLEGAVLCYDAFISYIQRYAQAAKDAGRADLAADLEQIAQGPATTFRQALQLIWLLVLVCQKVCGCGVLNLSRMDKYLQPLFDQDLANGTLDYEGAKALIHEFYFRNNEIMVQTDHMSLDTDSTNDTLELAFDDPNYLTLGGLNADGTSAVNRLSFCMAEAARDMKLRNPFIVARYHNGIDKDFWALVCDAMRLNTTMVIYNDETMIPALKACGVEEPEVYEYGFWGCNDPNIPALEGGLRQVWFNLAKPLELALNQGDFPLDPQANHQPVDCQFGPEDRMTGLMIGPYYGIKTKAPKDMTSMADLLEAYTAQVNYLMAEYRKGFEMDFAMEQTCTKHKVRVEDCFIKGTIENACPWTEGGTKYHKLVNQGAGLATVVDALYAIEKLVFEDQEMTLGELAEILAKDYEGHETLALRLKKKMPKFGNNIDEVDKYAKIVTDIFVAASDSCNGNQYLYQLWPTLSTDRAFTEMGYHVGATADGRRAREALSENQSPNEGMDTAGLTAMFNSLTQIPYNRITGGPLNVRIHPSVVSGEKGLEVMTALFETYMKKGGMQLQINVMDAATLKEAQANPEKYRSLCVRVTGYSAFFVEMGKKAQDEMIQRTEHSL